MADAIKERKGFVMRSMLGSSLLVVALGVGASTAAMAHGSHEHETEWVCMKDGKQIKVKGKGDREKKKNCVAKGGSWEKKSSDDE